MGAPGMATAGPDLEAPALPKPKILKTYPVAGEPYPKPETPKLPIAPHYVDAVKRFEGFNARPSWDYKQHSWGYGTRAPGPRGTISREQADADLTRELGSAYDIVHRHAPNAPDGVKAALTSLTFNTGADWTRSGLGQAVVAGDYDTARRQFLQYNKAGGKVLPGLVSRRQEEASWFNGEPPKPGTPAPVTASPTSPAGGTNMALGMAGAPPSLEEIDLYRQRAKPFLAANDGSPTTGWGALGRIASSITGSLWMDKAAQGLRQNRDADVSALASARRGIGTTSPAASGVTAAVNPGMAGMSPADAASLAPAPKKVAQATAPAVSDARQTGATVEPLPVISGMPGVSRPYIAGQANPPLPTSTVGVPAPSTGVERPPPQTAFDDVGPIDMTKPASGNVNARMQEMRRRMAAEPYPGDGPLQQTAEMTPAEDEAFERRLSAGRERVARPSGIMRLGGPQPETTSDNLAPREAESARELFFDNAAAAPQPPAPSAQPPKIVAPQAVTPQAAAPDPRLGQVRSQMAEIDKQIASVMPLLERPTLRQQGLAWLNHLQQQKQHLFDQHLLYSDPSAPMKQRMTELDLAAKERELTNPAAKLTSVKEGDTLIATDPRTGKHEIIATGGNKLSDGDKEAIREADTSIQQGRAAVGSLKQAIAISPTAFNGATASMRGYITGQFGTGQGQNTTFMNQLVQEQALGQLKATFGGNPTEGERKVMLDLQGSANMPHDLRVKIWKRAVDLAEQRIRMNEQRAEQIRGGTYYKPGGGSAARALSGTSVPDRSVPDRATAIDQARKAISAGKDPDAVRERLRSWGYELK